MKKKIKISNVDGESNIKVALGDITEDAPQNFKPSRQTSGDIELIIDKVNKLTARVAGGSITSFSSSDRQSTVEAIRDVLQASVETMRDVLLKSIDDDKQQSAQQEIDRISKESKKPKPSFPKILESINSLVTLLAMTNLDEKAIESVKSLLMALKDRILSFSG